MGLAAGESGPSSVSELSPIYLGCGIAAKILQSEPLPPDFVEVFGLKPILDSISAHRPLVSEDRKPGDVALPVFMDQGVSPRAFMSEAKIESCAKRSIILRLTTPDKPLILQIVHSQTHQQKDRLTSFACPLKRGRKPDTSNFECAISLIDVAN